MRIVQRVGIHLRAYLPPSRLRTELARGPVQEGAVVGGWEGLGGGGRGGGPPSERARRRRRGTLGLGGGALPAEHTHARSCTGAGEGEGGGGYFGGIGEQSVGDGFPRVLLSGGGRLQGVCAERVRAAGGAVEDCDATGRGATDAVSSRSPQFARFGSSAQLAQFASGGQARDLVVVLHPG